jgi:putative transposase
MSRDRYKVVSEAPHFITCTVVQWLAVFSDPAAAKIVLDSLRHIQDQDRISLIGYVLMENHVHIIASSSNLAKEIGIFKSFTERKIKDY